MQIHEMWRKKPGKTGAHLNSISVFFITAPGVQKQTIHPFIFRGIKKRKILLSWGRGILMPVEKIKMNARKTGKILIINRVKHIFPGYAYVFVEENHYSQREVDKGNAQHIRLFISDMGMWNVAWFTLPGSRCCSAAGSPRLGSLGPVLILHTHPVKLKARFIQWPNQGARLIQGQGQGQGQERSR